MSAAVRWTGALLLALGLAISAFKVVEHELPLSPTDDRGPWQVELSVSVRGDGQRGSVRSLVPDNEPGQVVFDERFSSDRLEVEVQDRAEGRLAVWSGWLEGVHEVVYRFRVQSTAVEVPLASAIPPLEVPRAMRVTHLGPSATFPATTAAVKTRIEELALGPPSDPVARVQKVFAFVAHEIALEPAAADDALLTLDRREGSALGKERLLVTLLRAGGRPARLVQGLELREGARPATRFWVETWLDELWVPLSASEGFVGGRPAGWVALSRGNRPFVEATGARAVGHRVRSLRERLRPDEIASLMAPDDPILSFLSLYQLPVGTQKLLRMLLLLPLGALITAVFRNVIGIRTYGTFMPALIALALRDVPPLLGLGLLGSVVGLGIGIRLALERLRLLLVPRLSILLCVVVIAITAIALVGHKMEARPWLGDAALPIVILTIWIERITITSEEEGSREALRRGLFTLLVSGAVWPVFQSEQAGYLMFTFPELVLSTMGLLIWIGGYTGFRLTELLRFRSFPREETPA